MARVADAFDRAFADGRPDVLLLQEAFVPSATRLAPSSGYGNFVRGPGAGQKPRYQPEPYDRAFLRGRRILKGEKLGKILNSGLVLATEFGIDAVITEPFGRRSCAGYDCLANKGMILARINVPGMPAPLFVLNTHLNARSASGASPARSLYAHNRQAEELARFLEQEWRQQGPLIYAGDFNTKNSHERFTFKDERLPGDWAHRYCHSNRDLCDVRKSWDSDEPWMDTQDLQGFADGNGITIEPVEIAAMFDSPVDDKMLSDHDALSVTYRLSWDRDQTSR